MSGILNSGRIATILTRWTAAKAAFLDAAVTSRASQTSVDTVDTVVDSIKSTVDSNLDAAVSSVAPVPPAVMYGIPTTHANAQTTIGLAVTDGVGLATASSSTYNVWFDVISVTAAGTIQLLNVYEVANAASLDAGWRLTIDGVVVLTSDTNFWDGTGVETGACLIGSTSDFADAGLVLDRVPFNTSFKIEARKNTNSAGTVEIGSNFRYYTT